jgi:hypothetical protein
MKALVFPVGLVALFGMYAELNAASVQKCSRETKTCVIRLEEGLVGDRVSVLNDRAQPVAVGWIVKRDGTVGEIKFKEIYRDVRRGYPVIVDLENRGQNRELAPRLH